MRFFECTQLLPSNSYWFQLLISIIDYVKLCPIYRIERQCNKEATYDGIHIPKDMNVAVNTYALHYSEEYYTDPETFDPDRYINVPSLE